MSTEKETLSGFGNLQPLLYQTSSDLLSKPLKVSHVRQTSLQSWNNLQDHLADNQNIVLSIIKRFGPVTNKKISYYLNWNINCVTPRTLELRNKNLVVFHEKVVENGRNVMSWRVLK